MTDLELHAQLMAKLGLVMADVVSLSKTGVNTDQGYAFIEATEVLDAVHKSLVAHRLAYTPAINAVEYTEGSSRSGNTYRHYLLDLTITLHDCETGATWSVPWKGESIDYQDKGLGKALTLCLKYYWLQTLLISTGETDPDAITPITEGRGPRPTAQSRTTQSRSSVEPDEDPGAFVMFMGKHRGKTLREIASDPDSADYLQWVIDNVEPKQPGDDRSVLVANCKALLGMIASPSQAQSSDEHWTVGQDWPKFYIEMQNKLGLDTNAVHTALGVDSSKNYKGTKAEAWAALVQYATDTVTGWANHSALLTTWANFLKSIPEGKRPSPGEEVSWLTNGVGNLTNFDGTLAVAMNIVRAKVEA